MSVGISALSSNASNVIQFQQMPPKQLNSADMFQKLCGDLGLDSSDSSTTITKEKLQEYIDKIESGSSGEDAKKLGFLKQLMENFDQIAGEDGEISEAELAANIDLLRPSQGQHPNDNLFRGVSLFNWQDPSEITAEQLISPIDLRV